MQIVSANTIVFQSPSFRGTGVNDEALALKSSKEIKFQSPSFRGTGVNPALFIYRGINSLQGHFAGPTGLVCHGRKIKWDFRSHVVENAEVMNLQTSKTLDF